jgi:hypothetical protein
MATGYLQAQFESLPGNETNTPTLSTKSIYIPLRTFEPQLGTAPLERDDELRGVDEPIAVLPDTYAPSASLDVRAYPDVLGFLFKAIIGAPTTTAGNGVITDPDGTAIPTGAFKHVWTAPFGPTGAYPQTVQFQAAYKDESVFFKGKGWAPTSLELSNPDSGGVGCQVQGPCNYLTRVSDPSLSATYESLTVAPFVKANLSIQTWLTNSGATSSGDFSVAVNNPVVPVRSMGIASRYPDVVEKDDGPIVVTGSVSPRHLDVDDWDALIAATGFATKARWQSTVAITGSYKYALWQQCLNAQYLDGGPEALANRRRTGAQFRWKATYSGTPGSASFTLVNATSSYA